MTEPCGYSVASIIMELAVRAGMDPRMLNVSKLGLLSAPGFAITNSYPATSAMQSLSQIFAFDASNFDGRVQFIPRGENTVATITEDELLDEDEEIDESKREDTLAVPRVMNLNYYDLQGGLATDKQTSERGGDRRATGELQLQTPVVLSADQAKQALIVNHKVTIEDSKGELRFRLPDKWLRLVASNCIFLQWRGRTERGRITRCDIMDGFQEYRLRRDRQTAYVSNAEGFPAGSTSVPAPNVAGPTLLEILDIPILHDVDDGLGLSIYIAVSGLNDAWQGASVELSYDGGANYVQARDARVPITIGELVTGLADHPADFPDQAHTCRVRILTPNAELEETDLEGLQNRKNLAIIGDEIVQFAGADEVEQGVWELSYFLRGRKDTGTAAHDIGERFVMLDELTALPAAVTDLGRTLTFRATTFGSGTETGTVKSATYTGASQRERHVGYLTARREGTDAIVTWQGVARLGGGANVAHGARFDGYRVRFFDGSSPELVVDTDEQQLVQDISALSLPVTISVAQLNGLTGPGPATEVELE